MKFNYDMGSISLLQLGYVLFLILMSNVVKPFSLLPPDFFSFMFVWCILKLNSFCHRELFLLSFVESIRVLFYFIFLFASHITLTHAYDAYIETNEHPWGSNY